MQRVRAGGADDALESKYQSILMTSADAIISVDERRAITEWTEGAENIFGYSRAEALGTSLEALLPERHRCGARWARHAVRSRIRHRTRDGLRSRCRTPE